MLVNSELFLSPYTEKSKCLHPVMPKYIATELLCIMEMLGQRQIVSLD